MEDRRKWLEQLSFFDANCQIFDSVNTDEATVVSTPEKLIGEMDRCGVSRAMVWHGNIVMAGSVTSNADIAKVATKYSDRFVGIWSFLTDQCDEIPGPDELFRQMKENNIGALTLMPTSHRFMPVRIAIGKTMDAATERKVPVVLFPSELGSWKGVYDFMREFPNATVILTNLGLWGADRNIRPLLEAYPNLHVELGQYWVPEGIDDLVKIYGADRLLYGSDMPHFGFGSTMIPIINSSSKREDVEKMANGNITRLISWK